MTRPLFTGRPEHFAKNARRAARLHAGPAYMETPEGERIAAVGIFDGQRLNELLPVDDALRLANALVDAAERHDSIQGEHP